MLKRLRPALPADIDSIRVYQHLIGPERVSAHNQHYKSLDNNNCCVRLINFTNFGEIVPESARPNLPERMNYDNGVQAQRKRCGVTYFSFQACRRGPFSDHPRAPQHSGRIALGRNWPPNCDCRSRSNRYRSCISPGCAPCGAYHAWRY